MPIGCTSWPARNTVTADFSSVLDQAKEKGREGEYLRAPLYCVAVSGLELARDTYKEEPSARAYRTREAS